MLKERDWLLEFIIQVEETGLVIGIQVEGTGLVIGIHHSS